jgi:hypothetical protein
MRTVALSTAIGGAKALTLRLPGRAVVARIASLLDGDGRLPADAVARIASRLSGISEGAIARLPLSDRTAIRHAIEGMFAIEARRLRARSAVASVER